MSQFLAVGTIGCCAVSFLVVAQPSSSGERGLILSGCVWFLCGSIDPVATYLRGRAPCCLFWRREGSPCEAALTIRTVHQSSLRPTLEQAKCGVCMMGTSVIVHTCLSVCPDQALVVCMHMFACVSGVIIKHPIASRAELQPSLLGYRGLDKDYGSQWQAGLSVPLPAQNR